METLENFEKFQPDNLGRLELNVNLILVNTWVSKRKMFLFNFTRNLYRCCDFQYLRIIELLGILINSYFMGKQSRVAKPDP